MSPKWSRSLLPKCAVVCYTAFTSPVSGASPGDAFRPEEAPPLAAEFRVSVDRRLDVPAEESALYARLLDESLARRGVVPQKKQFSLLVDRNPRVQAAFLYWGAAGQGGWSLVGAVPVSTGLPGRYEHFETPLGVYEHSPDNPDFRAEGTFNALHIRGYGLKGSRVFDFGWVAAPKGWGDGRMSEMRLQVHATDPDVLEPRLGSAQSKGCIRIPSSFNRFLDTHGVLDAAYDEAMAAGRRFWVLRPERTPSPWAGRWLVVVDSARGARPLWSPPPRPR